MTIGEFAQLTGLSVKALRLYDEQGLLVPAEVDQWSRYRRYAGAQLADAVRLKAMRAAGVSLVDAQRLLAGEDVLGEHRRRLAEERERQDAALVALEALLDGRTAWRAEEREAPAQHWAGVVMKIEEDDDDTEQANEAFAGLWKALAAQGNAPAGAFWSSMRAAGETVELLCCWPVARPVEQGWEVPGLVVESGTLPAGPELVVRWRHDDPVPLVDGAAHPAVLALLADAEERGVDADLARLRQIGVIEDGEAVGVEVSIPLRESGG
ncbi:MerR family DNA-binding transcriptional regulator [Lentzea tibetensis]|uniref:MerR family DNA-binding transcriptional regulator n=1 Tax=Lentzea tibetensis TaxID=2591470 RepID=A0A563F232_9PSEU|nr:MerR family transcriptional regulator [Lentzea tibetensis]TWP53979.1 MerR family DNA-binding transcriptional regulator [Lentzea tibetensis]